MEPGGQPPQPRALSAAAKLRKDGKQTSSGWTWLGALSSDVFLKLCPPLARARATPGVQGGLWVCHCGKAGEALSGQRWWRKAGSVLLRAPGRLVLCLGSRGCHVGENTRGQCACWILISGHGAGAGSVTTPKGIWGPAGRILTLPLIRG